MVGLGGFGGVLQAGPRSVKKHLAGSRVFDLVQPCVFVGLKKFWAESRRSEGMALQAPSRQLDPDQRATHWTQDPPGHPASSSTPKTACCGASSLKSGAN